VKSVIQLKAGAYCFFPFLLAHPVCAAATQLPRDNHPNCSYLFESDIKEGTATITEPIALLRANEWAARFYDDPFLQFKTIEWCIKSTRFWLVTFIHSDTGRAFYAVVLPDVAIVDPTIEYRS
jgi:hypothetical protein